MSARLYKNPHGDLAVDFTYPGLPDRFRISLGVGYTKELKAEFARTLLKPLKKAIAALDLPWILQRFPDYKRLQQYAAKPALTVNDLLDYVQQDYDQHGYSNAQRLKSLVKYLREYFADQLATALTSNQVEEYKTQRLGQGHAKGTINRELAALRRGYTIANRERQVLQYAPHIQSFKENNARQGMWNADELEAILKYLPDYLHAFTRLAFITGWRKTELLTRQWKHVDLTGGFLRLEVGETKNKDGRSFPLDFPGVREIIDELQARRAQELKEGRIIPWLFHLNGQPLKACRHAWDSAMEKAIAAGEIAERRLIHDFRRTAVSNFDQMGISQKAAMKLSGHRTDAIYRRYSITNEATMRWVVDQAWKAIGGRSK